MANATTTVANKDASPKKDMPFWAVPVTLGILLVSTGIFMVLLAISIDIMSKSNY